MASETIVKVVSILAASTCSCRASYLVVKAIGEAIDGQTIESATTRRSQKQ